MQNYLYRITTPYACGGIIARNNIVHCAAPIFEWMVGKNINFIKKWKNATKIELVEIYL